MAKIKLIDFLVSCPVYSGEIYTLEFESEHSFEWDSRVITFTAEGVEKFHKILNSTVIINKQKNIQLQDDSITEEEFNYFMNACAGYIAKKEYDKYFQEMN